MNIPLVDLKAQYKAIQNEMDLAIRSCLEEGRFISGPAIGQFEKDFATFSRSKHCIACSNGTDALEICLRALGVGPGDEVIVPAMSFISTSESVTNCGASVVFCDIRPDTYNLDVDQLRNKITQRTKAIVPVHLYGQMAEMDRIQSLAESRGIAVIEDAAQAHGALYDGKPPGYYSSFATYSFYPGKNLGAYGDAGAITTDDDELAPVVKMWTNHGRSSKYDHQFEGRNSRMDTLQAYILRVKLRHMLQWTEQRRAAASVYMEKLLDIGGITLPVQDPKSRSVFHLFVIRTDEDHRDPLMDFLKAEGIQAGIHYPVALPFLGAYRRRQHTPQEFPEAYQASRQVLSLPLYPELSESQIDYVVSAIKQYFTVKR